MLSTRAPGAEIPVSISGIMLSNLAGIRWPRVRGGYHLYLILLVVDVYTYTCTYDVWNRLGALAFEMVQGYSSSHHIVSSSCLQTLPSLLGCCYSNTSKVSGTKFSFGM